MEDLETPTPSLKSFDLETGLQENERKKRMSKKEKSPAGPTITTTGKPQLMMQPLGKLMKLVRGRLPFTLGVVVIVNRSVLNEYIYTRVQKFNHTSYSLQNIPP